MGCGCNFANSNNTEEKNELVNNELIQIEEVINNDKNLLELIIKIQSIFRGMKLRSTIKNVNMAQNYYDMNITNPSQLMESTNYHIYNGNQISQKDLEGLFNAYEPLDDNVKVEINGPIYENNSTYYGEWDFANNVRHGRGIQFWSEGSRYYGYWVKDKANIRGKLIHKEGDIGNTWYVPGFGTGCDDQLTANFNVIIDI